MTLGLDLKETFNGITYHGRIVRLPEPDEAGFEELTMFEEGLADVLIEKDTDDFVSKEAQRIDERIFCYVPINILQHDDEYVINWCHENGIDL